jgi:hypothetical protein
MAALAVAAAVQTSSRAIAQTAPASKDAGSTTTLTAEQKKNVAPVKTAPARTVVHTSPVVRNVSRPTTKSFSRPTSTTRSVVKSTKPISPVVKKTVTHVPTGNKTLTHVPSGNKTLTHVPTGTKTLTHVPTGTKTLTHVPSGTKTLTHVPSGTKTLTHVPSGNKTLTQGPGIKKILTKGPGVKKTLTQGPGSKKILTKGPGIKKTLTQGPSGKKILSKGPSSKFAKTDGRRRIGINRDRRRIFVNNRWRTLIPLIALGTFMYDDDTYYADGYVSMAEPGCTGYAEDGSRLRWMAVPTEDGGSEYQCVAYSTQRNRTVTEITVPEEPVAEAPPPAPPSTTGVGPANEPAVASPEPGAAPATGCELLIYSEANFKGLSAPVDENQTSLSEDGWQNEIASLQIKSGTWDFYSDEAYAGEMMRLSAGSYPTLDPKWNKHIGSFMCSAPAK